MNNLEAARSTIISRYLPFALDPSDPDYRTTALMCAIECESWGRAIRQYSGLSSASTEFPSAPRKLPKDYYFIRLEKYQKENAPLSKFYIYNPHSLFKEKLKKNLTKHIDKVESLIKDKSILIREALELARRVNVRAPYFKNMSEEDIYLFIERYKKTSDIN